MRFLARAGEGLAREEPDSAIHSCLVPTDPSQLGTGDLGPSSSREESGGRAGAPAPGEQAGDSIGPYHLLQVLGEGGFGTVWLAERRDPIVQRVALKIIKPGMDSKAVIARFEQERQALALMDHPCIARVLDAGATPMGRPFFVMEHVKGAPITDYCDRQRLTVKERLELFARVCEAVQHAHSKGIIHRDLKPSNILVAIAESGAPRPVVIDFGVAKAIAGRLTEKTVFTQHGQIIGTPEYMSPEQAEMAENDIDTRTDIYALGVVLYELLTGALPFDPKTLRAAGYAAIQKIIRESDPPHPSTRLSSMSEEGTRAALARRVRPEELAAELRSELEWIPLKAMRKDRVDRYQTALELAGDVANYIHHRPLSAGPESGAYRARKFVRRHRGAVLAAGAVAGALLLGAVGTTIGFVRARAAANAERTARVAAVNAEAEAKSRAREAEAVNSFLVDTLQSPSPMERGPNVTVAHVLKQGAPFIATGFADQPLTQLSLNRTYAKVFRTLNLYEAAADHAGRALELARKHRPEDKALLAELLMMLATAKKELGLYDQTAAALYEARTITDGLGAGDSARVVAINNALGALCHNLGDYDSAERCYRASVAAATKDGKDSLDLAISKDLLGRLLVDEGYLDEAQTLIQDASAMRERVSGANSTGAAFSRLTRGYLNLALGKPDVAAADYRAARDLYAKLHQTDQAPMARLAAMDLNGLFEDAPADAPVQGEGKDPTARAESINLGGLERAPVISLRNRARLLYRAQPARAAEADLLFARAIETDKRVGGPIAPASEAHTRRIWGDCLLAAGNAADAEKQFQLALDLQRRSLSGESRSMTAQTLLALGAANLQLGRAAEALPIMEEAVALRTKADGKADWTVGVALAGRGETLRALNRLSESQAALLEAHGLVSGGLGGDNPRTALVRGSLRNLYTTLGQPEKAAELD
mgnify:CR=1 FL=1